MAETLKDLDDLAAQLPDDVILIVWLNEHFGKILHSGKDFYDMATFSDEAIRGATIASRLIG